MAPVTPFEDPRLYILQDREPVPEPDLLKWAVWFESADRHVKQTIQDDVTISTVFLGLDHGWGDGPPVLYETMVFGLYIEDQWRYSTWKEAEEGHDEVVKKIFTNRVMENTRTQCE
jgi:hypothetical protein